MAESRRTTLVSLTIAGLALVGSFFVPEVRRFIGLEHDNPPPKEVEAGTPSEPRAVSSTNSENTAHYTEPAALGQSSQDNQGLREEIVEEARSEDYPREKQVQEQPKGRNMKPLAGAFVRLFYFGDHHDGATQVMSRLARLGATVELHELNPDESYDHLGTLLRNSSCWEIAGKELESATRDFKEARVQAGGSCELGSLDLFLEPHRSGL